MEDASFQRVMTLVCTRPRMFVWDGTFRTAAAYLDGYDTAVALISGKGWQETDLHGFRVWLTKRLPESDVDTPRNLGWSSYVESLYPDDETRFRQLPILFHKYLMEREQGDGTV